MHAYKRSIIGLDFHHYRPRAVMTAPGDFCVNASSIRFPLVAAGLINSAVGALLQQLSLQFFELALIPSFAVKENENPTNPDEPLSLSDNTVREQCHPTGPQHSQSSSLQCGTTACSVVSPDTLWSSKYVNNYNGKSTTRSLTESVVDITRLMDIQVTEEEDNQMSVSSEIGMKPEQTNPVGLNTFVSSIIVIKPEDSTGDISNRRSIGVEPERPRRQTQCPFPGCGKVLSKRCMLRHIRQHTNYRPYRCGHPGCTERFVRSDKLKNHSNVHLTKKERQTFPCLYPECGKIFFLKDSLTQHATVHSGEPMFNCDHPGCTQRFFYRRSLSRHQLTHLDDEHRPRFECKHPGCGRSFPYATNLSKHMLVHGSGKYICDYRGCGKQFIKKSGLKAHRWRHLQEKKAKESTMDLDSSKSSSSNVSISADSDDGDGVCAKSVIVDFEEDPLTPAEAALLNRESGMAD